MVSTSIGQGPDTEDGVEVVTDEEDRETEAEGRFMVST
jgi:hypothetical protein